MTSDRSKAALSYPQSGGQKEKVPYYDLQLELVKEQLKELEHALDGSGDLSGRFNGWCAKTAGSLYPDIGTKAHAVPHCFQGQYNPKKYIPSGPDCPADTGLQFLVSIVPESTQRGDRSHRVLGRALRVLNGMLERRQQKTMFIISQMHYDNVLYWIRHTGKAKNLFSNAFPKVFDKPSSYIDLKEIDTALTSRRGELDLMVLHEEKGIIFIQVKSISRASAGRSSELENVDPDAKIKEKVTDADDQLTRDADVLQKVMSGSSHCKGKDLMGMITRVIAVPNLTKSDLKEFNLKSEVGQGIIFLCKEDTMDETAESIDAAESEANIDGLLEWWGQLPSLKESLPLDFIKEIVGKYIGPLSAVLDEKAGKLKDSVRQFLDCVKQANFQLAQTLLTHTQRRIFEHKTKGQRRVYISGPPGSGKTILLILKAAAFLQQSPHHHVIVVNMYRGAPGRAIGKHVYSTINKVKSFKERLYELEVDVDRKEFVEKANEIFAKAGLKRGVTEDASSELQQTVRGAETHSHVGPKKDDQEDESSAFNVERRKEKRKQKSGSTSAGPKKEDEAKRFTAGVGLTKEEESHRADGCEIHTSEMKDVLFLVDEIYIESFWEEITSAFSGEFSDSEVWCAGLFSKNPSGFEEHNLDVVLRCPPAVQNLLYHVDWDQERKKKYRRDTEWAEVSCNGPIPLCVRHEDHESRTSHVIDCAQCAVELACVLKGENLIKTTTPKNKALSAPVPQTSGDEGTSTTPTAASVELKVVLLVNIPRDKYSKAEPYIETTDVEYTNYMADVEFSQFVKTLRNQRIHVNVRAELACRILDDGGGVPGSDVMATWLYNFQGLEAGVVIFLPGDPAGSEGTPAQDREIPAPGLKTTAPASKETGNQFPPKESPTQAMPQAVEVDRSAKSASSAETVSHEGGEEQFRSQPPVLMREKKGREGEGEGRRVGEREGGRGRGEGGTGEVEGAESGGGKRPYSLTRMQWTKKDIAQYSEWDKTNILVAGSRSLSLLILMVP